MSQEVKTELQRSGKRFERKSLKSLQNQTTILLSFFAPLPCSQIPHLSLIPLVCSARLSLDTEGVSRRGVSGWDPEEPAWENGPPATFYNRTKH